MTKEEAIKELKYIRESFAVNEFSDEAMGMAIEALEEQNTGKWIRTAGDYIGDDVSGYYDYHWSCSECEREAIINDWNIYELSDYCPHCGCKMEV